MNIRIYEDNKENYDDYCYKISFNINNEIDIQNNKAIFIKEESRNYSKQIIPFFINKNFDPFIYYVENFDMLLEISNIEYTRLKFLKSFLKKYKTDNKFNKNIFKLILNIDNKYNDYIVMID